MDKKITYADIKALENRLWKGDRMCDKATGEERERMERFWIELLREYEDACRAFIAQGGQL